MPLVPQLIAAQTQHRFLTVKSSGSNRRQASLLLMRRLKALGKWLKGNSKSRSSVTGDARLPRQAARSKAIVRGTCRIIPSPVS